jgi:hypothetical protein
MEGMLTFLITSKVAGPEFRAELAAFVTGVWKTALAEEKAAKLAVEAKLARMESQIKQTPKASLALIQRRIKALSDRQKAIKAGTWRERLEEEFVTDYGDIPRPRYEPSFD